MHGEIPIYHLYYANRIGDLSTILTAFPYRQAGWMGRRGTNQLRTIRVSVPADSLGYWADRLRAAGVDIDETERFGTRRLEPAHPCGIPYAIVGETEQDDREPWDGGDVPLEHAIRGAHGTTTSVREPGPMDEFLRRGMGAEHLGTDGPHHQYRIGVDGGGGRVAYVPPAASGGSWARSRGCASCSSSRGRSGWRERGRAGADGRRNRA